jgi:hypothetical protein
MKATESIRQLASFALVVFWGSILLGLGIPWLSMVAVDLLKHGQSIGQALHQWRLHLFAPGYNLFLVGLLNAIPFVLFAVFTLLHLGLTSPGNSPVARRRAAAVAVTGLMLTAFSLWTHIMTLWHPDAQGALAYVFLPIVLIGLIPVAYALGRGLGFLFLRAR